MQIYKDLFNNKRNKELEIALKVEALVRLLDMSKDFKHKDSFNANKLLLQGGWITEESNTKGRPSKEDIRNELTRLANLEKQYIEDMDRINMDVNGVDDE